MRARKLLFLVAFFLLLYPFNIQAVTIDPYYIYTVYDATTGDNTTGDGWYVTPGADEHENDLVRERPLSTNDFISSEGEWVNLGKYYAYLDIVSAQWGYDETYLYFSLTLFGNWDMDNIDDTHDYGVFGSGTLYNIILGQSEDIEANGSFLLRATGDNKDDTWTTFDSKTTQGFWDENGDVGDSGITTTKEEGDSAGNGYEEQVVLTDGYLDWEDKPEVLFARITGATSTDDSQPIVEIAFDYAMWNRYATAFDLPLIYPDDITLLVFETNRGTKDNQNYLWNDKYTLGEEGSPYNIYGIKQLGNVYELDRVYWDPPPSVPEPTTIILLGLGIAGLTVLRRKL